VIQIPETLHSVKKDLQL